MKKRNEFHEMIIMHLFFIQIFKLELKKSNYRAEISLFDLCAYLFSTFRQDLCRDEFMGTMFSRL